MKVLPFGEDCDSFPYAIVLGGRSNTRQAFIASVWKYQQVYSVFLQEERLKSVERLTRLSKTRWH